MYCSEDNIMPNYSGVPRKCKYVSIIIVQSYTEKQWVCCRLYCYGSEAWVANVSIIIVQSYTEKQWVCCRLYCYGSEAWVAMPTATNKWYSFGIAWYYGDNDFIIRTSDFIACSDVHIVQCSTDTDSRVTCSNNYFLETAHSCKASPLTPIHSHDTSQVHDILMTFHKHALVILCGERRNDYEQRIYTPTSGKVKASC